MKKLFTLLLSLASLSLFASDPQSAYNMYKQGKAVIIDVREVDELKPGMIEGAQWFPLSKLQNDTGWKKEFLQQTKGKEIFLYCRSGARSGKAQSILKDSGIKAGNIGGYETLKGQLPVRIPGNK